ncbi:hypothetical protein V6Z12_D05G170400 [Gossypium hirsutum]
MGWSICPNILLLCFPCCNEELKRMRVKCDVQWCRYLTCTLLRHKLQKTLGVFHEASPMIMMTE